MTNPTARPALVELAIETLTVACDWMAVSFRGPVPMTLPLSVGVLRRWAIHRRWAGSGT